MMRQSNFLHFFSLFLLLVLNLSGISASSPWQKESESLLQAGFLNPPQIAKPLVWWDWINGSVTKEGIEADLQDMKLAGIGGVQLFDLQLYMPEGPIRYGTDRWHEYVQFAIQTADRLGLEFHIMNCPGWSASAGPWIKPENSMKRIVWSEKKVQGPTEFNESLPRPEIKNDFYRDIAVYAVPVDQGEVYRLPDWEKKILFSSTSTNRSVESLDAPDKRAIPLNAVLNLSRFLASDGVLSCQIPEGKWTILRFGFTTTGSTNHPAVPEGHGLEVDKLDPRAVKFQFDQALSRIICEAKPYLGKTFKGILFDSFEGGFQNWTDQMPTEFERRNGYDLMPYLPVITGRVITSAAVSEAVLYDFRCTIDQMLAEYYFGTMQRLARQNQLILYSESQGGPLNPFFCNEYVDVPMNEFWVGNYMKRIPLMKQTAASANLYGRQIVGAEAFTAVPEDGKWQNTPYTLKRVGDSAFAAGINRFIFHTYVHQPYSYLVPGFTMGRYGTHFGRLNSWWKFVPAWISYLSRSQYLLQQGERVTDIGFLFHDDLRYSIPTSATRTPLGFDYTICYPKHLAKMQYRDGWITVSNGPRFQVLVLPDYSFMTLEALKNIHRLVQSGATVVGNAPAAPPGLKDLLVSRKTFQMLVSDLWGGLDKKLNPCKSFGKGKVFLATPLEQITGQVKITPDIQLVPAPKEDEVLYIHRETASEDIYFISNQKGEKISLTARFRVAGKRPEFWDPATGKIWNADLFNPSGAVTEVPLQLDPYGSIFVIFRHSLPEKWVTSIWPNNGILFEDLRLWEGNSDVAVSYSDNTKKVMSMDSSSESLTLDGPWQVRFLDGRGAPAQIQLNTLISWTEHANPGVRYYSGIAEYQNRIRLPKSFLKQDEVCLLDLGKVCDIAQVRINGSEPVILWKEPFQMDVTNYLKAGENIILIEVANRWINRLIGDEQLPADCVYRENAGKFTNNGILEFPDWLTDPARAKNRQRHTFATWRHYSADSPLVPSGLMGPVRLCVFNRLRTDP